MNVDRLFDVAAFSPRSLQPPNGWVGHLPFAYWLITEISPKVCVELGTHTGNSYFSFCQSVADADLPTKCYAVDTWLGDAHAGYYGDDIFYQVNDHNQEYYTRFSRLLRMTFDEAVTYFADGTIDLLHIDGMHTYDEVKHDFETWLPKLTSGALVLFHDINVRERDFGVWKFWEEIQERYPLNLEFMNSNGLGVVSISNSDAQKQIPWFLKCGSEQQVLKNYFVSLGIHQIERYELKKLYKDVTEKNGQIDSLNLVLTEKNEQIDSLNLVLTEKNGQIDSLNLVLTEKNGQIDSLNLVLTEKNGQIDSLNLVLTEKNGQIDSLNLVLTEKNGQIDSLNLVLTEKNGQIDDLLQSSCWRLTAPFRAICHQFKRFKVLCSLTPKAIRQGGGFIQTTSKTLNVLSVKVLQELSSVFSLSHTQRVNPISSLRKDK